MFQNFTYLAPKSMKELYTLLMEKSDSTRILAGGTDFLVGLHNNWVAPASLIDIKKISELKGITFSPDKGLAIGATTVCVDLINDKNVRKYYPLLAEAVHHLGSPQLRNRATIAGNLCTASPCADMGCSLLSLNASVEIGSAEGVRIVALKDFFFGPKKTQIKSHEVLQRILVPADMAGASFGMEKLKRIRGHDLALVSVAMARTGKVIRAGIGSCAPTPVVTADLPADASVDKVIAAVEQVISPIDDIRASRDYRLFMVREFVQKIYPELFKK